MTMEFVFRAVKKWLKIFELDYNYIAKIRQRKYNRIDRISFKKLK
jgi:hypothetical protein